MIIDRSERMPAFKGKKVLVTGGSGFIASHLCHQLINNCSELFVTTKYNSVIDNIRLVDIWGDLHPLEIDLRNADALKILESVRPDIIYHFAAYNHVGDSFLNVSEAIDSNSKGSVNLLEAYDGFEKFVYISSSEVYGYQESVPFSEEMTPHPISPYSIGKYAGELYARMKQHVFDLPIVVIRPFNAFGPYQSERAIIPEIISKCLSDVDIATTPGDQTREFNFIDNLVDGFLLAAAEPKAIGEVINIGSGEEISIRDLVMKIHTLSESESDLKIGTLEYRPTEIWRMFADNRKAKEILGWEPKISFEEGLSKTIQWFREYRNVFFDEKSSLIRLS